MAASAPTAQVRFVPIGDIPMLFNRLSSLRDDQDRREVIYAKNLPLQLAGNLLKGHCGRSTAADEAK